MIAPNCTACGQRAQMTRCACGECVYACHCLARARQWMNVRRGRGCDLCRAPDRAAKTAIYRARGRLKP